MSIKSNKNKVKLTTESEGRDVDMSKKLVRFDWAIKRLLRSKANFGILEGLLSEIIKSDVKIINVLESEGNKKTKSNKFNRVDIIVEDEKKEIILIELQVATEHDFLSRLMYGAAKVITEYIKETEKYINVKKVFCIGIVYFDIGQGKDYVYRGTTSFIGIHTKDELILNENQKHLYKKEYVKDIYPEFYIIKVNSFNDVAKDTLDQWIYFLKNEEIKDDFNAKGLIEAKEKLDAMKLTDKDRKDYDNYLEDMKHEASMMDSSYGLGEIKGEIKGRIEGKIEGKIESVLLLLTKKFKRLPNDIIDKISKIRDVNVIEKILDEVFEISSVEELEKYL